MDGKILEPHLCVEGALCLGELGSCLGEHRRHLCLLSLDVSLGRGGGGDGLHGHDDDGGL